jgi:O-antigen/teichoic acid export membrane protein
VDSLLPALTNCLSTSNIRTTIAVAEVHLRLIFPAVLWLSLALSLFVRPVLAIMGPHYLQFAGLVQVACLGAALQSFNGYNNTIFTATDRVRHGVIATVVRCIAFAGSFWPLWLHLHVAGAVLSWIIGESAYHGASLYLLHRHAVIKIPMAWTYFGWICAVPVAVTLDRQALRGQYLLGGALACLALIVFFTAGRYTAGEIRSLARLMIRARTASTFD